jgi:hypothetical protein
MKKQMFAFTNEPYIYTFTCDGTNASIKAVHTTNFNEWLSEFPTTAFGRDQFTPEIVSPQVEVSFSPEVIFSIFEKESVDGVTITYPAGREAASENLEIDIKINISYCGVTEIKGYILTLFPKPHACNTLRACRKISEISNDVFEPTKDEIIMITQWTTKKLLFKISEAKNLMDPRFKILADIPLLNDCITEMRNVSSLIVDDENDRRAILTIMKERFCQEYRDAMIWKILVIVSSPMVSCDQLNVQMMHLLNLLNAEMQKCIDNKVDKS